MPGLRLQREAELTARFVEASDVAALPARARNGTARFRLSSDWAPIVSRCRAVVDRLDPVLLDFVDGEERALRAERVVAGFERTEGFFRAVQQTGLQEILPEFEERVIALTDRQIGAAEKILMHAYRAIRFAAAAEQVAEREMQFDGFGIELDDFDKRVDRLVQLLVEQEVEAAEIGTRQIGAF